LIYLNKKYFANFLEIIFKYVKVNYNLITKILLFKHAYNFGFIFVRNFKQFIFWEVYLNTFMHSYNENELTDIKKTHISKKLCNL